MISRATVHDMPEIMDELRLFVAYHPQSGEFNTKHIYQTCLDVMKDHVFLVSREQTRLAGFIAGIIHQDILFPERTLASEVAWWVCEPYRGTSHAARLLRAWHIAIADMGADISVMRSTIKTPTLGQLYVRAGYVEAETAFVKEL